MINLEQLADGSIADRNFQKLMSLVPDSGGRTVGFRFGTTTLSFTASTNSAAATVTHGLGRTPIIVEAMALNAAFGNIPNPVAATLGTTTFILQGEVKTAFTGSVTMMWLAVG